MFRKQITFGVLAATIALVFAASDAEAGRRGRRNHCGHGSYHQTSYSQTSCCDSGSYGSSNGYSTASGCGTNGGACGIPAQQTSYSTGTTGGSYQSGQSSSGQYQSGNQSDNMNRNLNSNNLNRNDSNRSDVNANSRSRIDGNSSAARETNANVDIVEPPAPSTTTPNASTPDAPAAPASGT